jgi:hypothetical protein
VHVAPRAFRRGENGGVDATREAEELVRLWQELQTAQVTGDTRALAGLRVLAEAHARRPEASGEWALLVREAGRYLGGMREQVEAEPVVGARSEPVEVPEAETPATTVEPAGDEEAEKSGGFKLGPLIWLVFVVGYLLLQLLGNVGEGGG